MQFKLRLDQAIRPGNAGEIRRGVFTQTKMERRRSDDLLLGEQACPDLDFSANPKRVNALVATSGRSARTNDLPVIAFFVPRFVEITAVPFESPTRSRRPSPFMSALLTETRFEWPDSFEKPCSSPRKISPPPVKRSRRPLLSRSATEIDAAFGTGSRLG